MFILYNIMKRLSIKKSNAYADFIKSHIISKANKDTIIPTHTSIKGGSYYISEKDIDTFYKLYYEHVFKNGSKEYLVERQLINNGPILLDLDLKYTPSVNERQHKEDDIVIIIDLLFDSLKELVVLDENTTIPVYVFEKPNVNIQKDHADTKDGIHIVIGIKLSHQLQLILREKVISQIDDYVNLPITNTWEDVFDISISRGSTPWQLYGSMKPNHDAYILTYNYKIDYDSSDGTISVSEQQVDGFINGPDKLKLISARYEDHISLELTKYSKEKIEQQIQEKKKISLAGIKRYVYNSSVNLNIRSEQQLNTEIEKFFHEDNLRSNDYHLKEIHQYTMILPDSYSHRYDEWIKVGWALKNTDDRLFLTWIKFSTKSNKFKYSDISQRYDEWQRFDHGGHCLSSRSIIYWAKHYWDNKEKEENVENEFNKIAKTCVNYYVEKTITENQTDFDFAKVLTQMFSNQFVCVAFKNDMWYKYEQHRWIPMECGIKLKYLISTDMHDVYQDKIITCTGQFNAYDQEDDFWNDTEKRVTIMSKICTTLKDNGKKDKIMKEARVLFYDNKFIEKIDANPNLLGFDNGIVDFKEKRFRPGYPHDYISKSTKINYIPLEEIRNDPEKSKQITEIETFMSQLFPDKTLCKYIWELLASCLIGINYNQTFNIFMGIGSNGKSLLLKLMKNILGEYYELLPLSYITQKRTSVGQASSEIAKLQGVRLTGTNESSENDKFNEGVIKELTGGDPIQARALWKDSITFVPQCKVILATNNLPEITATDEGTWRRIRQIPFESRFVDKPVHDDPLHPYQFKKDMTLETKINNWNETFMAMLVDIVFKTNGIVNDCDKVMACSNEYRSGQDVIVKFMTEKIRKAEGKKVQKGALTEEYGQWFRTNFGKRPPKMSKLFEAMNQKFGKFEVHKCWRNVEIIYDEGSSDSDSDSD